MIALSDDEPELVEFDSSSESESDADYKSSNSESDSEDSSSSEEEKKPIKSETKVTTTTKYRGKNIFGEIAGCPIGTTWERRVDCAHDGVHR